MELLNNIIRYFSRIKVLWKDERELARRITKTNRFVELIVKPVFGSVEGFCKGLTEASPDAFAFLTQRAEAEITAKIRDRFRQAAVRLLYSAELSEKQWRVLREELVYGDTYFLPCYRTLSRFWKKQGAVDENTTDEQFFLYVEAGGRSFSGDGCAVSVKNRVRWVLYMLRTYCCHIIHEFMRTHNAALLPQVNVKFQFLLWDDGGAVWGLPNGLFSALKGVSITVFCAGYEIVLPPHWYRYFIERSWTLSVNRKAETKEHIAELHKDEVRQWKAIVEEGPISFGGYVLTPELLGFTADHGARAKSVSPDSRDARCGECAFKSSNVLTDAGCLSFFNWDVILGAPEVDKTNWAYIRFRAMPVHIEECDFSILSYDNLHNFGGHLKSLFSLLICDLPTKTVNKIEEQISLIVNVPKKSDKYRVWDHFKGWQWRKCSRFFSEIFGPTFRTSEVKAAFNVVFELLTEIHMINYVHFRTTIPEYEVLHMRYALILYMYTLQLQELYPPEKLAMLDNVYLHKLLLHSLVLFRRYCPAACSCETGEGKISSIGRWLRICSCRPGFFGPKLFRHIILDEEETARALQQADLDATSGQAILKRRSRVFEDDFVKNYRPKELVLSEPCTRGDTIEGRIRASRHTKFLCAALGYTTPDPKNPTLRLPKVTDEAFNRFWSLRPVSESLSSGCRRHWIRYNTAHAFSRALGCADPVGTLQVFELSNNHQEIQILKETPPSQDELTHLRTVAATARNRQQQLRQDIDSYINLVDNNLAKKFDILQGLLREANRLLNPFRDTPSRRSTAVPDLFVLPDSPETINYGDMTCEQLKAELRRLNLPVSGRKNQLVDRLQSHNQPDRPEQGSAADERMALSRNLAEALLLEDVSTLREAHLDKFRVENNTRSDIKQAKQDAKERWDSLMTTRSWVAQAYWDHATEVYQFFSVLKPDFFYTQATSNGLRDLQTCVGQLYAEHREMLRHTQRNLGSLAKSLYNLSRFQLQEKNVMAKIAKRRCPPSPTLPPRKSQRT